MSCPWVLASQAANTCREAESAPAAHPEAYGTKTLQAGSKQRTWVKIPMMGRSFTTWALALAADAVGGSLNRQNHTSMLDLVDPVDVAPCSNTPASLVLKLSSHSWGQQH